MKLSEDLQKKLRQLFTPSSLIEMSFRGNDVAFKTDKNGNAVLLFIGRKNETGLIKGERYVRTLKAAKNGTVIKDHWELKGKAS